VRRLLLSGCVLLAVAVPLLVWANAEIELRSQPNSIRMVDHAPARPLDVSLDPSGQPYDVWLPKESRVARRPLMALHAPSRRVLFMGGEYVMYAEAGSAEPVLLAERPGRRYPVDAIWLHHARPRFVRTVGVVVVERTGAIARWQVLPRTGYVTDGGVGGITTPEWAARSKGDENAVSRLYRSELVDKGHAWFASDVDGHDGLDSLVFDNGYGDGFFPAIAGYDAAGRRLAVVLWSFAVPWRLAFPDGRPPADVTRRERVLARCIEGAQKVDGNTCLVR
jgi:hypothetical protein